MEKKVYLDDKAQRCTCTITFVKTCLFVKHDQMLLLYYSPLLFSASCIMVGSWLSPLPPQFPSIPLLVGSLLTLFLLDEDRLQTHRLVAVLLCVCVSGVVVW